LWVSLQIDCLWEECHTDAEIKSALANLPKDLNETYARCLKRIDAQKNQFAPKILKWICAVSEPFTVQQLREALAVDPQTGTLDYSRIPTKQELLRCCCNLVIRHSDDTVTVAHHSVFQFLVKEISINRAKQEIGYICIKHLRSPNYHLALQRFDTGSDILIPLESSAVDKIMSIIPKPFRYTPSKSKTSTLRIPRKRLQPSNHDVPSFFYFARDQWPKLTAYITTDEQSNPSYYSDFRSLAVEPNLSWRLHPWEPLGQSLDSHYLGLLGWAIVNHHTPLVNLCVGNDRILLRKETFDAPIPCYDNLPPLLLAARSCDEDIFEKLVPFCNNEIRDYKGRTGLYYAADSGFFCAVSHFINAGIARKDQNNDGLDAFHAAVTHGSLEICQLLVDALPSVLEAPNYRGQTALHLASINGHESIVQWLLEFPVLFNTQDKLGFTAICYAAERNYISIARMLITEVTGVNLGPRGSTPLHIAAEEGHTDMARLLLDMGAFLERTDRNRMRPIDFALRCRHDDLTRLFLERGANVLSMSYLLPKNQLGDPDGEGVKSFLYALDLGADIDSTDIDGNTVLHHALKCGSEPMTRLWIDKKVGLDKTNNEGLTALHIAVQRGCRSLAIILIENGANVKNAVNVGGETILHLAIKKENKDLARLLIENGANVNASDSFRISPLHLMIREKDENLTRLLIESGADINATDKKNMTPLHLASSMGVGNLVTLLIEKGANINAVDKDGCTPLHLASSNGYYLAVEILVESGAKIEIVDKYHRTALHHALHKVRYKAAFRLIKGGTDFNIVDCEGRSALHLAIQAEYYSSLAPTLIEKGANIEKADIHGRKALHYAARLGFVKLALELVQRGTDPRSRDRFHKRPSELALGNHHYELSRNLRECENAVDARAMAGQILGRLNMRD
jgi:ankyrin repeat protein